MSGRVIGKKVFKSNPLISNKRIELILFHLSDKLLWLSPKSNLVLYNLLISYIV